MKLQNVEIDKELEDFLLANVEVSQPCRQVVIGDLGHPAHWKKIFALCDTVSLYPTSKDSQANDTINYKLQSSKAELVYHFGMPSQHQVPKHLDGQPFDIVVVNGWRGSGCEAFRTVRAFRLAAAFLHQSIGRNVHLIVFGTRNPVVDRSMQSFFDRPVKVASKKFVKVTTFDKISPVPRLPSKSTLKFKVFLYETPKKFTEEGYDKGMYLDVQSGRNQFSTDYIIHHNMLGEKDLRTWNRFEAELFFLPYYPMSTWRKDENARKAQQAGSQKKLEPPLEPQFFPWVTQQNPHWSNSNGSDHVMALPITLEYWTMKWSSYELLKNPPVFIGFEIPLKLYRRPEYSKNIVTPYPCFMRNFLRKNTTEILQRKEILFSFAGSVEVANKPLRQNMKDAMSNCTVCTWIDLKHRLSKYNSSELADLYERSIFCYSPAGHSPTAKRLFDGIQAVCIPIIVSDNWALPFGTMLRWDLLSFRFPESLVKSNASVIVEFLRAVPMDRIREMQQALLQVRDMLLFHLPTSKPGDAFHLTLLELEKRAAFTRLKAAVTSGPCGPELAKAQAVGTGTKTFTLAGNSGIITG